MDLAQSSSVLECMRDTFTKSACAILYEFQELCFIMMQSVVPLLDYVLWISGKNCSKVYLHMISLKTIPSNTVTVLHTHPKRSGFCFVLCTHFSHWLLAKQRPDLVTPLKNSARHFKTNLSCKELYTLTHIHRAAKSIYSTDIWKRAVLNHIEQELWNVAEIVYVTLIRSIYHLTTAYFFCVITVS